MKNRRRQRKPDFILNLPNGRHIIIDGQRFRLLPINYCSTNTTEEKSLYLKQHLKSITDHIDLLANQKLSPAGQ